MEPASELKATDLNSARIDKIQVSNPNPGVKSDEQLLGRTLQPSTNVPASQTEAPKPESSFFGFGARKEPESLLPASTSGRVSDLGPSERGRSRSPSPQTMSKVFGFGSSIFSSASNLISSAVQHEPSLSSPRRGSTVSQSSVTTSTPPTPRKGSTDAQVSGRVNPVEPESLPSKTVDEKEAETKTEPERVEKTVPAKALIKPSQSTCPICQVDLNVDPEKLPPNYNTCTGCKEMVCNLCGFNPTPHISAVSFSVLFPQYIYCILLLFTFHSR